MKKLLAVLLAMAMMLALAACGDTGSQNNGGQNGENQSGTGDTNTDQNNPSSGEVTFGPEVLRYHY